MTTLGEVDVAGLPATVDTREAAAWLGVHSECLYDAAKAGTAPVVPLRVGRRLRWPTALLLEALGIEGCACHGGVTPRGTDED